MSGGVDSSVAAGLLVQQGYDVVGITMRLWTEERDDLPATNRTCCGVEAVDDAQEVAHKLGIPYYVLNYERAFKANVVDYFVGEYAKGRTPNPCLACNQYVKFDPLLQQARALGADYLATGHYARVRGDDGGFHLLRGVDPRKDQSYFLYTLGQEELRSVLFPVGGYTKDAIRGIAAELGLPVADKADSQEICFIQDNDYRRFVNERLEQDEGEIVDGEGRVLGAHRGIANFTIGQRQGLGLSTSERVYVTDIDAVRQRVVVGTDAALYREQAFVEDVRLVRGGLEFLPAEATVKIRYKTSETAARLDAVEGGVLVAFQEPQRALTPGQAMVFYHGEAVIGGGIIARWPRIEIEDVRREAL